VLNAQISWLVELTVKPGQLNNFRALTGEMVESTRGEPGVLSYERFVSHDGNFVHAHERYADSAAALAHLRTFEEKFGGRFLEMVDWRSFVVFGTPTEELRKVLDRFGAMYLRPFGDFAYLLVLAFELVSFFRATGRVQEAGESSDIQDLVVEQRRDSVQHRPVSPAGGL
jgi:quinol monooxygenase YgiN